VALRQIASDYRWRISIVGSSDAAVASLNEQPTPLVICDRDLTSEDWREALAKIAALPQAVCVLLASRVVDDSLWRQVIRHHGYDVVSKPFQPEELRRAVTFAWSWRGWAHRHYSEVLGKPTA
jgi:DNA-binding NtrC family response regulator